MLITVIIPAFNEESVIVETLQAVGNAWPDHQAIVVDDGSNDETGEKARRAGALVIRHQHNQGKGAAINSAAPFVRGDIVVLLDADLGKSAYGFTRLLSPIFNGSADVTVAKFPPSPVKGGFGMVKGLATEGVFRMTGCFVPSVLSGQRAMRYKVFQSALPFASGFGIEVGATIDILRQGWRLQEVEIDFSHHYSGRNLRGFIHRGHQFFDICRVLKEKL